MIAEEILIEKIRNNIPSEVSDDTIRQLEGFSAALAAMEEYANLSAPKQTMSEITVKDFENVIYDMKGNDAELGEIKRVSKVCYDLALKMSAPKQTGQSAVDWIEWMTCYPKKNGLYLVVLRKTKEVWVGFWNDHMRRFEEAVPEFTDRGIDVDWWANLPEFSVGKEEWTRGKLLGLIEFTRNSAASYGITNILEQFIGSNKNSPCPDIQAGGKGFTIEDMRNKIQEIYSSLDKCISIFKSDQRNVFVEVLNSIHPENKSA